jgi:hypothetical protein
MKFVVRICDGDGLRIWRLVAPRVLPCPLFAIVVARLELQPKTLSLFARFPAQPRAAHLDSANPLNFDPPNQRSCILLVATTISETSTLSTRKVVKGLMSLSLYCLYKSRLTNFVD